MKSSLTVIFLFLAGLLLLTIGSAILVIPHIFYSSDGILLGSDPSLLSEIRASGGLLTGGALIILIGTFRPTLQSLAVTLSILIYGSFGLSRLLGLAIDGIPSNSLLLATMTELIVASIGLILLCRQPHSGSTTH